MNRKLLPLILMLTAGTITSVMTFILGYSLQNKLFALLLVLLIFYFLGSVIKWLLDYFDRQNEKKAEEEGEVIEKEADAEKEAESEGQGGDE